MRRLKEISILYGVFLSFLIFSSLTYAESDEIRELKRRINEVRLECLTSSDVVTREEADKFAKEFLKLKHKVDLISKLKNSSNSTALNLIQDLEEKERKIDSKLALLSKKEAELNKRLEELSSKEKKIDSLLKKLKSNSCSCNSTSFNKALSSLREEIDRRLDEISKKDLEVVNVKLSSLRDKVYADLSQIKSELALKLKNTSDKKLKDRIEKLNEKIEQLSLKLEDFKSFFKEELKNFKDSEQISLEAAKEILFDKVASLEAKLSILLPSQIEKEETKKEIQKRKQTEKEGAPEARIENGVFYYGNHKYSIGDRININGQTYIIDSIKDDTVLVRTETGDYYTFSVPKKD